MPRRPLPFLSLGLSLALLSGSAASPSEVPQSEAQETQLQGQLRLARGVPVVGATVLAYLVARPGRLLVTATDEKGFFKLDGLESGTYRFEARREGLEPLVKPGVVLRYPYRTVVEATMTKAGDGASGPPSSADTNPARVREGKLSLEGTVRSPDGDLVAEARVRLSRPDASVDPRTAFTGSEGSFEIQGLKPGSWDLEVLGGGYLPLRVRLDLWVSTRLGATLVAHPVGYLPPPQDLMPPEEPIPPPTTPPPA